MATPPEERCEITELLVDECSCRLHKRSDEPKTGNRRASGAGARRAGVPWEQWEDEAVVDLYERYGPDGGGIANCDALDARMERSPGTTRMRLGNVDFLVTGGARGLSSPAEQTRRVVRARGLLR